MPMVRAANGGTEFKTVTKSVNRSWSFTAASLGMEKILGVSSSSMTAYRTNGTMRITVNSNGTSISGSGGETEDSSRFYSWSVTIIGY